MPWDQVYSEITPRLPEWWDKRRIWAFVSHVKHCWYGQPDLVIEEDAMHYRGIPENEWDEKLRWEKEILTILTIVGLCLVIVIMAP
jgi:hypothetical protein